MAKVRGRKNSIKELFERLKSNENLNELSYVFITHVDCEGDAIRLKEMIDAEYHDVQVIISDIGQVIGAHTGSEKILLFNKTLTFCEHLFKTADVYLQHRQGKQLIKEKRYTNFALKLK